MRLTRIAGYINLQIYVYANMCFCIAVYINLQICVQVNMCLCTRVYSNMSTTSLSRSLCVCARKHACACHAGSAAR